MAVWLTNHPASVVNETTTVLEDYGKSGVAATRTAHGICVQFYDSEGPKFGLSLRPEHIERLVRLIQEKAGG